MPLTKPPSPFLGPSLPYLFFDGLLILITPLFSHPRSNLRWCFLRLGVILVANYYTITCFLKLCPFCMAFSVSIENNGLYYELFTLYLLLCSPSYPSPSFSPCLPLDPFISSESFRIVCVGPHTCAHMHTCIHTT